MGLEHESKGNDRQLRKLWLLNEFSLSVPKEMYGEEYGEDGYWYKGVDDLLYFQKFFVHKIEFIMSEFRIMLHVYNNFIDKFVNVLCRF